MTIKIDTDQKVIVTTLAEAIATFDITKVAELLSEEGEYQIQNGKEERIKANKPDFLKWLGNPVIILENGRFPVFSQDLGDREKCGFMLEFKGNLVSDISFCYLFMKTDNSYLFEKRCHK